MDVLILSMVKSTTRLFPRRPKKWKSSHLIFSRIKVARYSFSTSIPPKFERKLRRHKQGFGKIDTTVVLDKEENWL